MNTGVWLFGIDTDTYNTLDVLKSNHDKTERRTLAGVLYGTPPKTAKKCLPGYRHKASLMTSEAEEAFLSPDRQTYVGSVQMFVTCSMHHTLCVCACVCYVCYIRIPAAGWMCKSLLRPFNPEAPGGTYPSRGPVPERADWVVVTIRPAWATRGERFYGNKNEPTHTHTGPHTHIPTRTHVCTNTHTQTDKTHTHTAVVKQSKGLWGGCSTRCSLDNLISKLKFI